MQFQVEKKGWQRGLRISMPKDQLAEVGLRERDSRRVRDKKGRRLNCLIAFGVYREATGQSWRGKNDKKISVRSRKNMGGGGGNRNRT